MVSRTLRPKRSRWLVAMLAAAAIGTGAGAWVRWSQGWAAGDPWGQTFGVLAAALIATAALYPWRRLFVRWFMRTAQDWLQFHIYGGTFAAVFVVVHLGFRWPVGRFGWVLFALMMWTTASGLLGVALQKLIPTIVTRGLTVEVVYDRIPDLIARLQTEARDIADGSSEVLLRFYEA